MNFGEAIGECFFNFTNFRDRAARAEYWWWALFVFVVLAIAWLLDFVIFRGWTIGPFYLVFWLASLLPTLSVTVRRFHDTGRSGWWLLVPLGLAFAASAVTIANFIAHEGREPSTGLLLFIGLLIILWMASTILLIVWMALPSISGNNAYGPNRYAGD